MYCKHNKHTSQLIFYVFGIALKASVLLGINPNLHGVFGVTV